MPRCERFFCLFFFFNDTATTEIYTLSLHDALPISPCVLPVLPVIFLSGGAQGARNAASGPQRTRQPRDARHGAAAAEGPAEAVTAAAAARAPATARPDGRTGDAAGAREAGSPAPGGADRAD